MSTERRKEISMYLKRTRDFRAWFARLPEDVIRLDVVMTTTEKAVERATRWAKRNGIETDEEWGWGIDDALSHWQDGIANKPFRVPLTCGSVGCVMGWAEYSYIPGMQSRDGAADYFGTEAIETASSQYLFAGRRHPNLSQRAEALQRLDTRIAELQDLLRETPKDDVLTIPGERRLAGQRQLK